MLTFCKEVTNISKILGVLALKSILSETAYVSVHVHQILNF